ncbi:MAG: SpoIIE family protein phosphatase [Rhodospirillales bacterium]|nr:SpoIIE family protein phosphatase [Acetobacter sp.]
MLPAWTLDLIIRALLQVKESELSPFLLLPVVAALALFPITLAYVTVVQRALDVGVILRESLQYALARRGVVVLQSIVSLVVVVVVALWTGEVGLPARFAITATGVLVVLALGFGAERLAGWIDRRFFREANQAERSLADLASRISSVVGLKALVTTVEESIRQALHVPKVALFVREGNRFSNAGSTLETEHSSLISSLERSKGVLKEEDHRELQSLGSQIVVPVARNSELLAFLSLGARKAEAPYTRSDIALLQSVASQTALAIDNTRLTESIAAEVAEREVLTRELAIAREVQSRLFPQVHPQRAGLDYYGHCRPAREVGGDYYDYFELPHDGLGIAIGDVAGKGVPAALLMASLQAALRGQTVAGSASLPALFTNINRLIYATTPTNRYATFFYAQYNPQEGTLAYINAGHNAPILLRSSTGKQETIRLGVGGPPIGLLPACPFEEGTVQLCPGDVLALYTDGISEAMNEKDEEWGEDCLIAALAGLDGKPSAALVKHIFEAADRFANGAPQHDDMTFMVFRFA